MIGRRHLLHAVSAGAGGSLLKSASPNALAAPNLNREVILPKRLLVVMFDNGFAETSCQPPEVRLQTDVLRDVPLESLTLPHDIAALSEFRDRMTIVQGITGQHVSPDHGAGFGALSGVRSGPGKVKYDRAAAASVDAEVAKLVPGVFPLLVLGIDPGNSKTTSLYASSAWAAGTPIAAQCRPEIAFEKLFGNFGAKQKDYLSRRNVLDFVADDVRRLRRRLGADERVQLDHQLQALQSLSRREEQLSLMRASEQTIGHLPPAVKREIKAMPALLDAQFAIASSALITGLTNVVTITSGLCRIRGNYTGFSDLGVHAIGHNKLDPELGMTGNEVLSKIRRYIAEQTAELCRQLERIPEDGGSMLDHTVIVYTSDSANRQHTSGENWPFLLIGNTGGRLRRGRLINFPMVERGQIGSWDYHAKAAEGNPAINAIYATLLHAFGSSERYFNDDGISPEQRPQFGILPELIV